MSSSALRLAAARGQVSAGKRVGNVRRISGSLSKPDFSGTPRSPLGQPLYPRYSRQLLRATLPSASPFVSSSRPLSLWPFSRGSVPEEDASKAPRTGSPAEPPVPAEQSAMETAATSSPPQMSDAAASTAHQAIDATSSVLSDVPTSAVAELANAQIEHGLVGRVLSSNAEWLLCQMHDLTGLTWLWSIPVTIVLVRLGLLRMQIGGMQSNLKNMLAKPVIEGHIAKIRAAQQAGKQTDMLRLQEEFKRLTAETGFSPFGPLKYPFVQGLLFSSFFFAFKNMGEVKLPSMMTEGTLWFTDLTAAGPAYGLPLIATSLTLLTIETSADQGGLRAAQQSSGMIWGFRGLILAMWFFFYHMPSAIFVYWITNNLFGLLYALFSRSAPDSLRSAIGLPTKAQLEEAKKVSGIGQKNSPSFMDGFRAMQEQAQKAAAAQQQRRETPWAPTAKPTVAPEVIQASPIPSPPSPHPPPGAGLFETPSDPAAHASPSRPATSPSRTERTGHGALNVESPEGHAEGAEVGSGAQVGELLSEEAPVRASRHDEPQRRFGRAIKEAGPVTGKRR